MQAHHWGVLVVLFVYDVLLAVVGVIVCVHVRLHC